jgi:hypothetical protein
VGTSINDVNGNELITVTATTSAVNELSIANAATGNAVNITTTGNDANIGLNITTKGTGAVTIDTGTGAGHIDIKPGSDSLRLYDDDSSHFYRFLTGNRTANYDISLPASNTSIPIMSHTLTFSGPTAARTYTLPNSNQTLAGLAVAQTFTSAQTFRAANAIRSEAASTQDAIVIAGRAGGTGSFAVTLTPTTLTANRTLTLADGNTTLVAGTMMTNPMTTGGDIIYGGTSGAPTRLAAGANGHVLTLSAGVPTWAAASGGGGTTIYHAKLTSDITITDTTAYNTGLSIADVVPGEYLFVLTGRWSRPAAFGTALSRAFRGSVHFDNATNVSMSLTSLFNSTTTSSTGAAGSINSLLTASATAGATNTFFQSASATTTLASVPFTVEGRISIAGSTNKTVIFSFSMTASDANNPMMLLARTNMVLIKVD